MSHLEMSHRQWLKFNPRLAAHAGQQMITEKRVQESNDSGDSGLLFVVHCEGDGWRREGGVCDSPTRVQAKDCAGIS